MQIHDLADLYRTKSDEELLLLSADADQLTSEAHAALSAELAARRISPEVQNSDLHEIEVGRKNAATVKPFARRPAGILQEVHRLYRSNFWSFARLAAPAVIVGFVAVSMAGKEVREISRHMLSRPGMVLDPIESIEIFLINFSSYCVSWVACCLSFAAICLGVQQVEKGDVLSFGRCYAGIRAKAFPILGVAVIVYLLAVIAFGLSMLIIGLIYLSLPRGINLKLLSFAIYWLLLLPLTRFGLAIPAVVFDGYTIRKAMFRSDELTEGSWFTLAVLIGESLFAGYIAGLLPFTIAHWLPETPRLLWQFPWLLTVASMGCVSLVESPLFIGFALLYLRKSEHLRNPEILTTPGAQVAAT